MLHLAAGALVFFGGHVLLSAAPVRPGVVARLGERGFLALYSTIALIGLVWLGYGYAVAPREVWWGGPGLAAVPLVLMAPAALLYVGAFSQRNPTSVGQSADADAARGIMRITRHPFLWAMALWAASHLAVNGDLPSLVLFGGILALSLVGMREIDRKSRRRDPVGFAGFEARTSVVPFAAIAQGRNRLVWSEIGWWRVAIAALLYAALIGLHPYVIGASPVG
ncbi:MAG TPA: NnrU family protein [Alphaproteobacteria bacterium]